MIRPGEIYYADLPEAGRRPVVVVSRELLNRGGYVCVVLFTTTRLATRRELDNCVFFANGTFGLTADCVAKCETLTNLHVDYLDVAAGAAGILDDRSLQRVIQAIGYVLQAKCESL